MARVTRGRIVRAADLPANLPPASLPTLMVPVAEARAREDAREGRARILTGAVADAHAEAARIVARARAEAERVHDARKREARADVEAEYAAALLGLRAEEERRAERDLERMLGTAVVLAERLVGEALAIAPSRILAMAQAALREARGARRVIFEANPLDAEPLRAQLQLLGLPEEATSIETNDTLARGDLVLKTNLGRVDARLNPQLQRLADALSRAGSRAAGGPGGGAGAAGTSE